MTITWNSGVRVSEEAPPELRPGEVGSVVGWNPTPKDGEVIYTVEFGDGSDAEVPRSLLELLTD